MAIFLHLIESYPVCIFTHHVHLGIILLELLIIFSAFRTPVETIFNKKKILLELLWAYHVGGHDLLYALKRGENGYLTSKQKAFSKVSKTHSNASSFTILHVLPTTHYLSHLLISVCLPSMHRGWIWKLQHPFPPTTTCEKRFCFTKGTH